jgi:hypothetical protein
MTNRQRGITPPIWSDRDLGQGIAPISVAGTGIDGNITISGTTTLTRDMEYNTLIIAAGGILQPDGYAVHVRRLLTNHGTIRGNGTAGGAGVSGGTALTTRHYGGSTAGGAGRNGAGPGNPGGAANPSKGGTGGAGGGDGDAFAGGAAGVVTAPTVSQGTFNVPPNTITLTDKTGTEVLGGSGGGGGAQDRFGTSGNGGSGGRVLMIAATSIHNTGTIQANGGAGGNAAGSDSGLGGGGGGGGGWIVMVYSRIQDNGTIQALGGAAGLQDEGGVNGVAGSSGAVLQVQL